MPGVAPYMAAIDDEYINAVPGWSRVTFAYSIGPATLVTLSLPCCEPGSKRSSSVRLRAGER